MGSRDPRDERTWDRFDTSEEPMYICPYCELDSLEFVDCDCKASKRIRELEKQYSGFLDALEPFLDNIETGLEHIEAMQKFIKVRQAILKKEKNDVGQPER